jgi:hypothetical protein
LMRQDRYFTVEAAAREAALFQPNVAKLVTTRHFLYERAHTHM